MSDASDDVTVAQALKRVMEQASPEARELVAQTLRFEREKQYMVNPRNIVQDIAGAAENIVKEEL